MMLAFLVAAAQIASASPSPPLPSITAPTSVVLLSRTPVRLVTTGPIDSRSVRQGQRFELRVAESVSVAGQVLVPAGTPAVGEVEAVSGKGMVGQGARLTLVPLFIDLPGRRITLTGVHRQQGANPVTGVAVTSLLVSTLGIFITGKSATVPAGSVMLAETRTDVSFSLPLR